MHQPVGREFPVLVAVGAKPLAAVVMPFIGKSDRDAIAGKGPEFLDQPIVQFARPFAGQECDDLGAADRKL